MTGTISKQIPEVKTEQYILRGLRVEDAGDLYPIMSNKETMKFITPHPVQSIAEIKESIAASLLKFEQSKELPWVIIYKATNETIGIFRFHKMNEWHKKAEMGVVIGEKSQNKGVMTEILPALLKYGFEQLALNRIVGDIFAGNVGSQQLLEKHGFQKEGILRQTDFDGENFHDTVVYSLLKSEYILLSAKK